MRHSERPPHGNTHVAPGYDARPSAGLRVGCALHMSDKIIDWDSMPEGLRPQHKFTLHVRALRVGQAPCSADLEIDGWTIHQEHGMPLWAFHRSGAMRAVDPATGRLQLPVTIPGIHRREPALLYIYTLSADSPESEKIITLPSVPAAFTAAIYAPPCPSVPVPLVPVRTRDFYDRRLFHIDIVPLPGARVELFEAPPLPPPPPPRPAGAAPAQPLQLAQSLAARAETGAPACSVCLDKRIQVAVTPCGHTFCAPCMVRILSAAAAPARVCPQCRAAVQGLQPIHIG